VNKVVQLKGVHLKATKLVELMEATVMMSEGKNLMAKRVSVLDLVCVPAGEGKVLVVGLMTGVEVILLGGDGFRKA